MPNGETDEEKIQRAMDASNAALLEEERLRVALADSRESAAMEASLLSAAVDESLKDVQRSAVAASQIAYLEGECMRGRTRNRRLHSMHRCQRSHLPTHTVARVVQGHRRNP